MKTILYKDRTIDMDLDCIVENLNRLAPDLGFIKGLNSTNLSSSRIITQDTYKRLSRRLISEAKEKEAESVFIFTEKPYDNNYFWESHSNIVIVSLFGWDRLTTLSRNNGVIYFICSILLGSIRINTHQENTGCINDFWRDKTGVDVGMRAAFICPDCMSRSNNTASPTELVTVKQVQPILHELSIASRSNVDICTYWQETKPETVFDVFLCHNSDDKDAIRDINEQLKKCGIKTWFDEEQLPPGRAWQELLEENIELVKTAAVFVSSSGIGPWQNIEIRAFLQEFVRRRCPVIPVILPSCNNVPQLPLFLSQLTWVDFRKDSPEPFIQLRWGITGKKPDN